MHISSLVLTTLVSAAMAAPATTVSMMAAGPEWTIENMKRVCNAKDTSCTWTFDIEVGTAAAAATACTYVVKGADASQANGGPSDCGSYTITSGWSGQFGPGNGFTTFSVVNNVNRHIIWPAYTDKQVQAGKVVKPNQSYAPAALP
ncbi:hypothetical protein N7474_005545 [Penicillium riverlandense]|uniref:uncharacterized protein n=1 Tax=Penicillium riverlandense TaxID=1903569 RepID=UPI0025495416|nr:uncharacterized protein N7474_005545 [Penicillium riverlandense]KAJ5819954.1 hypothetical protein N7474_005545 [Penicillium riverlandense]